MSNHLFCFFFDDSNVDFDIVLENVKGFSMLIKNFGYTSVAEKTFVTNQESVYTAICNTLETEGANLPVVLIDIYYNLLKSKGFENGAKELFSSTSLIDMIIIGHAYHLKGYIKLFYKHHDKTSLTYSPSKENLKKHLVERPTGALFVHRGVTDRLFETLFLTELREQKKQLINVVDGVGLLDEYVKVAKIKINELPFEIVNHSDRDAYLTEYLPSVEMEGHSLSDSDLFYVTNLIENKKTIFIKQTKLRFKLFGFNSSGYNNIQVKMDDKIRYVSNKPHESNRQISTDPTV